MTPTEPILLHMHPAYGINSCSRGETLPALVRQIILFHHETGRRQRTTQEASDRHVDQAVLSSRLPMTTINLAPTVGRTLEDASEPLSHSTGPIWQRRQGFADRFHQGARVYPPGTVVKLCSGKVGIVMSVSRNDILHPNLMIYDPTIPSHEAAVVNLKRDLDDCHRPHACPAACPNQFTVSESRKRICYFVNHAGISDAAWSTGCARIRTGETWQRASMSWFSASRQQQFCRSRITGTGKDRCASGLSTSA